MRILWMLNTETILMNMWTASIHIQTNDAVKKYWSITATAMQTSCERKITETCLTSSGLFSWCFLNLSLQSKVLNSPQKQRQSFRPFWVSLWVDKSFENTTRTMDLHTRQTVYFFVCLMSCVYLVNLTRYCILIEFSRPIRFFIWRLMFIYDIVFTVE